jgi:hypothetical protein
VAILRGGWRCCLIDAGRQDAVNPAVGGARHITILAVTTASCPRRTRRLYPLTAGLFYITSIDAMPTPQDHTSCCQMSLIIGLLQLSCMLPLRHLATGSDVAITCPLRCRCLDQSAVINCRGSALRHTPSAVPTAAIVLDLDDNCIRVLSNDSVVGTVEMVSLQDNGLVRIESGAFGSLPQLRILRLGRNGLTSLARGLFAANRLLQVLDLHSNMLTGRLPDHVLYHTHALVSLNVSHNLLTTPELGPGFRYVTQLADLDMSGWYSGHQW